MYQIISAVANLLFLRIGPQDLPGSKAWLWTTMVFAACSSLMAGAMMVVVSVALRWVVVELLLAAAVLGVLLHLTQRPTRFVQMFAAYCTVSGALNLLALPLLMLESGQSDQVNLVDYLLLGFFFWNVLALGNILRHGLEISLAMGSGCALAYALCLLLLL